MPDAGCGCDAGLLCDSLGMCVTCLTNADCSGSTPVCQSSTSYRDYGKCVGCSEDQPSCPGGEICDLSIGATYHHCVTDCRVDAGIPPCAHDVIGRAMHCSSVGTCAPGCVLDIDCAPDLKRCNTTNGECVPCLSYADCPFSLSGCESSTYECGYCDSTADCPPGQTCGVKGNCQCTDATQCGGDAPVCVPNPAFAGQDAGFCGCVTNADCASQNDLCVQISLSLAGACIPPCSDGGTTCNAGQFEYCDMTSGICGPCTDAGQCIGNDGGPVCLTDGRCGCLSSDECSPAEGCNLSVHQCEPACTLDAGGPTCSIFGWVCDPVSRECVECLSDTDCTAHTGLPRCTADIDAGNSCEQCLTPADCPVSTPGCYSGYYICGFCSGPTDCPSAAPICESWTSTCAIDCRLPDGGTSCAAGICQVGNGECVQCLSDLDCVPYTDPYCANDIDAGTLCVQCLQASQCGDAGPCNSQLLRCGSCAVNADCPPEAPTCAGVVFGVGSCSDGG
jgi:hypothetical protein